MRNHPLELVEHNSSILVIDYDVRQDSGGPGKFRGGVGQMMTVQALRDDGVIVARGMERLRFQPYGIGGGKPGAVLKTVFNIGRPDERELGKIHELKMGMGDTLTLLMPSGGGYGDPFERDPSLVLRDVRNGFVSAEAAERDYGVVICEDAVDPAATEAMRGQRERPPGNEQFNFGPDREAWEAVFDDPTMHGINSRLYALPKSRRQMLRRALFESVVPQLANGHSGSLSEFLRPTEDVRRRLREEIDRLLPQRPSASTEPSGAMARR